MTWINYLLQANIYLTVFFCFYALFLRNETYFRLNRVYLLGSAILSFLIPLFESEWVRSLFVTDEVYRVVNSLNTTVYVMSTAAPVEESSNFGLPLIIYLGGLVVFALRFLFRLFLVFSRRDSGSGAYSFFRKIVVAPDLENRDTILEHESVHVRQWHSADVILLETLTVINWFNPIIYLYKRAVKYIHEFIADETAANQLADKAEYAMLLLSNSFNIKPAALTNTFYQSSFIKRRIMMLNQRKSTRSALLKYGLSVPLFFAMVVFSSAAVAKNDTISEIVSNVTEKINGGLARTDLSPGIGPDSSTDEVDEKTPQKQALTASGKIDPSVARKTQTGAINYIKINDYVGRNYRVPQTVKEKKTSVVFSAKFTITSSGKVEDAEMIKNPEPAAGEELIRVLSKGSNFDPSLAGKYILPVVLQEGTQQISDNDKQIEKVKGYTGLSKIVIVYYSGSRADTSKSTDNSVYDFSNVEKLPEFPGGMKKFYDYVGRTFNYPAEAKKEGVNGRLIVQFVVETDGSLTDIKVMRDLGKGTGEEAVRVLQSSPKWTPATHKGKNVRVLYTLPIQLNITKQEPTQKTKE